MVYLEKNQRGIKELSLIKPVIWGVFWGNIGMNISEDFIKKNKRKPTKHRSHKNYEN